MSFIRFTILAAAFATLARGDHTVTFINDCTFSVTPMWKDNSDGASNHQLDALAPGARGITVLPEIWESGRLFAQDPIHSCLLPDGGNCTLVECDFGPGEPRFWQCDISLVSGYNIPTAYKFVGGDEASCTGFSCLSASCPMTQAYLVSGCDGCINQCNTDNVGLEITYCQDGSTLPPFAPKPASPPPPKAPPAPAPPKSNPAPAPAPVKPGPPPAPTPASPSAPENVAAGPTPSRASSSSAQPTSASKHCPRSRRKARRAHKRRMLELAGQHA